MIKFHRKLREASHNQIILNLSVSLAGIYIFYLIDGYVSTIPVLCGITAVLSQYFFVVFFAWTAVEAIWLYIKLVKIFGTRSYEHLYILKAGIPAWGKQ